MGHLPQTYLCLGTTVAIDKETKINFKRKYLGCLGGSVIERLPLAQVVILETRDRVPHRAPCMEPASPSACVSLPLSVCVFHE